MSNVSTFDQLLYGFFKKDGVNSDGCSFYQDNFYYGDNKVYLEKNQNYYRDSAFYEDNKF